MLDYYMIKFETFFNLALNLELAFFIVGLTLKSIYNRHFCIQKLYRFSSQFAETLNK